MAEDGEGSEGLAVWKRLECAGLGFRVGGSGFRVPGHTSPPAVLKVPGSSFVYNLNEDGSVPLTLNPTYLPPNMEHQIGPRKVGKVSAEFLLVLQVSLLFMMLLAG